MRVPPVRQLMRYKSGAKLGLWLLLCAALGVASVGCNLHFDLDSVELQSDTGHINGADADGGGTDTTVVSCSGNPGSIRGQCSAPGTSEGCASNKTCTLGFAEDHLETYCYENSTFGDGAEGDACASADDCQGDLYCVEWADRGPICSRLCELATGQGCASGQVCSNPMPDILSGVGFCTETCDPYDLEACSPSQSCTADPNFPSGACEPQFRCISNTGSSANAPGDACDAGDPANNCARGLVCAPLASGSTCVQPCQSNSQCSNGAACVEMSAPWTLSYCEISQN